MRKRIRILSVSVAILVIVISFVIMFYNETKKEKTMVLILETTEQSSTICVEECITETSSIEETTEWNGEILNEIIGTVEGPSGKETYYNLNMSGVIRIMRKIGYSESEYKFYIREDGVKMFGPYIMCAANLDVRPRGTIVSTSLGKAIVCDTGDFAKYNPTQLDIAVNW